MKSRSSSPASRGYTPISDYALIGDCHSAALVSRDGSIDWYCPGQFDAAPVFCRLLDASHGGYFSVTPVGESKARRRYLNNSNILETTHECGIGRLIVTDFMPIRETDTRGTVLHSAEESSVVRCLHAVGADIDVKIEFSPTFEYAAVLPTIRHLPDDGVIAQANDICIGLACPDVQDHAIRDGFWSATMHLQEGERRVLQLVGPSDTSTILAQISHDRARDDLKSTQKYWETWASRCTYRGPYRSQVMRSALVLKLLTYDPTGAVIAAPTTSLPEELGGVRNWDYRYTWLRDSSLLVYSLATISYHDVAARFLEWLANTLQHSRDDRPHIMYTLHGKADIPEKTVEQLEGYCGSRPVRVGNAASDQRQLDIYGEVLIAAYIHFHHPEASPAMKTAADPPSSRAWSTLRSLVEEAVRSWEEPDNGIWEVRGGQQHFVYSKLMCWAAVDRGIRMVEEFGLEADLQGWKAARDAIRVAIETRGYNDRLKTFTQAFDSEDIDAAVLAIPRIGFLAATDPRVLSTIECIQKDLTKDGLTYRYRTGDGLAGGEGTFLLCTFWLVDALALAGKMHEARRIFESVLALANDVGLFSEEIDPTTHTFLGNFPQGFTHLALVQAAVNLSVAQKHGPAHEAHTEAHRAHRAHAAAKEGHG